MYIPKALLLSARSRVREAAFRCAPVGAHTCYANLARSMLVKSYHFHLVVSSGVPRDTSISLLCFRVQQRMLNKNCIMFIVTSM